MMTPFRSHVNCLKVVVAIVFIFCLAVLSSKSEHGYMKSLQQRKMVLGSRPPGCVNKCLSCRPCMATLVVPSHQRKVFTSAEAFETLSHGHHDDDDGYYLLSWKCRCGDKLYQP